MRIGPIILAAVLLAGCGGPIDLTESYWPESAPPGEKFSWPDSRAWADAKGLTLSTGPFLSGRTETVWFLWNEKGLYGRFVGYEAPFLTVRGHDGRWRLNLLMPGTASGSWDSPVGGPETKQPTMLADTGRLGRSSRHLFGYGALLTRRPATDIKHLRTRFRGPVAPPGQHEGEIFISWESLGWSARPEGDVEILVIPDRKGARCRDKFKRFILKPAGGAKSPEG